MSAAQDRLLERRNREADAAYERAMAPARRSLRDPRRVPYPQAAKAALAAFDEVTAHYRPLIWEAS